MVNCNPSLGVNHLSNDRIDIAIVLNNDINDGPAELLYNEINYLAKSNLM